MEVGISIDGATVTSHILHQIWLRIQGSKHRAYLQDRHDWDNVTWNSIDWKGLKSGFLSLGPLKWIKMLKVCMVGSILAAKSQRSHWMRTNHTNVHDVTNPTKPKSTYWNVITLVLTRNNMILFIPWWRRYDLTTYAPSKKYLPSVSGPGSNLWKQLYWTWAVSTSHNVNYFESWLLTKHALVGIWQWEVTSVSTGALQYLQIDTLQRTTIKENLGYVRLSCCCGTLLTRCGSIAMMCYMIRNLKYLVPCEMLRLTMWSLSCMRRWIHIQQRIGGTLTSRLWSDFVSRWDLADNGL
jgi:hypothetical protein